MKARNETPGPYFAGDQATVAVDANYYAGGPLPNADVTWQVTSTPGSYSPPNWPDFTFGTWTPWWFMGGPLAPRPIAEGCSLHTLELTRARSKPSPGRPMPPAPITCAWTFNNGGGTSPVSVQAEATVMDVNRQAWTGGTTLLVHPASLYVGLRSDRFFVERGTPLKIDFIVTDLDGNPVADRPVEVRAARLDWKIKDGNWQEEEADVQTCSQGSAKEPVTCTFDTPVGGTYRITATVTR